MFDIGGPELIVIVLGIIVLFGPKKIPEIAQMIGKGIQKVRTAQSQFNKQINEIKSELKNTAESDNFAENEPVINEIKANDLNDSHFKETGNNVLKRDQINTKLDFNKDSKSEMDSSEHPNSTEFGFQPIIPKNIKQPYDLEKQEIDDEKELQ